MAGSGALAFRSPSQISSLSCRRRVCHALGRLLVAVPRCPDHRGTCALTRRTPPCEAPDDAPTVRTGGGFVAAIGRQLQPVEYQPARALNAIVEDYLALPPAVGVALVMSRPQPRCSSPRSWHGAASPQTPPCPVTCGAWAWCSRQFCDGPPCSSLSSCAAAPRACCSSWGCTQSRAELVDPCAHQQREDRAQPRTATGPAAVHATPHAAAAARADEKRGPDDFDDGRRRGALHPLHRSTSARPGSPP